MGPDGGVPIRAACRKVLTMSSRNITDRQVRSTKPTVRLQELAPNPCWRAGILEREAYQDEGARGRWSYHLIPSGKDLKVVLGALQQGSDVHVPRAEGPIVIRRDTRTYDEFSVGFIDSSGKSVPDDEVIFEPVAGGPADPRHRLAVGPNREEAPGHEGGSGWRESPRAASAVDSQGGRRRRGKQLCVTASGIDAAGHQASRRRG